MEFHPLANIFPMMIDEELNDLGDDMVAHGQREPIWSYESKILDGRNRYRAGLLKGIEPRIVEYLGIDPLGFVISMNLKRRHLDASQRAMVVAGIANLPKGSHPPIGGSSATQQVASKLLNVSVRSAQRARYVKDHGVPGLVHAVEQGDVKVAAAAEFTKAIPPQDQARLIDEYGSPASAVKAAVKAKADRASVWKPRPVPDPKAAADRAERRSQRHRERYMQLKRLLEACWALSQSGNPAQVARSMLLLEAREAKSIISRLREVATFANDVAIWMEGADTSAVLPQNPDAHHAEGDVTP
ncbi:hypothetical protein [Bradyrhizobium sp. URHD0069]|uniref:hypothetical protein n=1 Tax=Bradyrhizobium sp. URHD0069 TaxID=1380355 RepID=UPI000AB393C8|nr:hypothetical protein [Bradyrhizobium sp. URHD0069]